MDNLQLTSWVDFVIERTNENDLRWNRFESEDRDDLRRGVRPGTELQTK